MRAPLLLLAIGLAPGPVRAEAVGSLFAEEPPLRVTLAAPLDELVRARDLGVEREGTIRSAGGPTIPVRVALYGKTRLETCPLAPLVLRPDPAAARGTPFAGHQPLRIVPHCGRRSDADRWTVLEYLVYRAYGIVSDVALAVRLAEIEYQDTSSRRPPRTAWAFFVEDIDQAARRRGLEWLEIGRQPLSDLDPQELTVLALFQFMIGNTDWSVLRGPEGERCCHNLAVLGRPDSSGRRLLPFDFDNAGLVNAPYAVPSELLPVRSVRQRVYRGFCALNDQLPAAISRLRERHGRLESLFGDPELPYAKPRQEALAYLGRFFELIEDPSRVEKQLSARCRGPS